MKTKTAKRDKKKSRKANEENKKQYEMMESVFMDAMKIVVKRQLRMMSDIANTQDQVVNLIHTHDELQQWGKSAGLRHVFSPHFFQLTNESQAFFCLSLFLLLQLMLQLLFHGHFRHLAAHLPEFLYNLIK